MTRASFRPFADEREVRTVGELAVENRIDRVRLHGGLSLTRDRAGLAQARALRELLDGVVEALEALERTGGLPGAVAVRPVRAVPNPFRDPPG
ncbi:MAG: hypothetical protein PGN26_12780 [Xylophilus ampelinus]